jgi:hypothetical protein
MASFAHRCHRRASLYGVGEEETSGKLNETSLVQLPKQEGQNHMRAGMRWSIQPPRAHTEGKGKKLHLNYRRAAFCLSIMRACG